MYIGFSVVDQLEARKCPISHDLCSVSEQAKVLDRDGHELLECVKGYQFISDVANTKGHISGLTSGCWHPRNRDEFLTGSLDGYVWRIIDWGHESELVQEFCVVGDHSGVNK